MADTSPPTTKQREDDENIVWVSEFRHWRSGEIIRAEDYGKKAFPIRVNGRKR